VGTLKISEQPDRVDFESLQRACIEHQTRRAARLAIS